MNSTRRPRNAMAAWKSGESTRPYADTARRYLRRGWAGPLWLPPNRKEEPPTNFTGRGRPYPDAALVDKWRAEHPTGNICLRMGTVTVDGALFDVVGIDVDDYTDGDKRKEGGKQLAELEALHGPLPRTWRATSRDGVSGIRCYRAPAGHLYRGKAAPAIDIISPGYRYAVVWPSVHPSGRRYRWLDDRHGGRPVDRVPDPRRLPLLPDRWFERLTFGGMLDEPVPRDASSTRDELLEWARNNLPGHDAEPCPAMASAITHWLDEIAGDPSSHDKITAATWNILLNAAEGHSGWPAAITRIETVWAADVLSRGKRSRSEVRREIGRSKFDAIRKLKAKVEQHATEIGIEFISDECPCAAGVVVHGPRYPRSPRRPATPRRRYA